MILENKYDSLNCMAVWDIVSPPDITLYFIVLCYYTELLYCYYTATQLYRQTEGGGQTNHKQPARPQPFDRQSVIRPIFKDLSRQK